MSNYSSATTNGFLDKNNFASFKQLCSNTEFVDSYDVILHFFYNLDDTLTPTLPQKDALITFKKAFEKVQVKKQLFFNKLRKTKSPQDRQVIINRLGVDYTLKNYQHYCPIYAKTLFEFDSENNALSHASVFFAFFFFWTEKYRSKRKTSQT